MDKPISYNISTTHKGLGVFAARPISRGDRVLEFRGDRCSKEEYKSCNDPDNCHFLQIDDDTYLGPSGEADDFVNHSCDPNCGVRYSGGRIFLYAIRDIAKGEELTFDYSTTMDEDHWEMECRCGSKQCRGTVRDFKHLPDHVQKRYMDLKIVPPFILKKVL
jgi:SET domain-containing protein